VNKYFQVVFSLGLFASLCVGCGRSNPQAASVAGNITVEKNAMLEGLITFVPLRDTPGPKLSAPIQNGTYKIAIEEGMLAGEFRVEVFGLPPGVKAMMYNEPVQHNSETRYREIDAKYNANSELQAIITPGDNHHDFAVEYRPR
jgi:hypothetical protein